MAFCFVLLCFCRLVIGPWALQENNTLELANQSARYIDYKHKSYNKSGLLTKLEVKVAGYWPSSFFAQKQKKRTRPTSCHLDRTSLVNKGFIIWDKEHIFLAGHSARDSAIFPARVTAQGYVHLARSRS